MFISAKAAEVPSHNFDTSKEELIKIINNVKSNYESNSDNFIILKELCEVVKYSIPHLSNIKSNSNYNNLCKELINLENLKQDISSEHFRKILKIAKNI